MPLYLYDNARARRFEPFALTRPASELRAGVWLARERWEAAFGERAVGFIGADHLADFEETGAPPWVAPDAELPAGAVVANSRFLATPGQALPGAELWSSADQLAAMRLRHATGAAGLEEAFSAGRSAGQELSGQWVRDVWDLIRYLPDQLTDDISALGPKLDTMPPDSVILGDPQGVYVERGAIVEPYALFDVGSGPVLVRSGARVHAFTRIVGPAYVGTASAVMGDRVAVCAIGDACRVHGEISNSVILGHSNKSHDGFVGHSYLGRWVNLGAGTVTSNLKNTYGSVQLWTPDGLRDTGLIFLGSMIGDYAKTGIGTRLTTGSVIGAGANIFPSGFAPKVVPPFAWGEGDPFSVFELAKFLEVAERQMKRRQASLSEQAQRHLTRAHRRGSRPVRP